MTISIAKAASAGAALLAFYAALCLPFGLPIGETCAVALYLAAFIGLPAFVLQRTGRLGEEWPSLIFALTLAHAIETCTYFVLLWLKWTPLYFVYPLLWFGGGWLARPRSTLVWPRLRPIHAALAVLVFIVLFAAMTYDYHAGDHHAQWLLSYTHAVAAKVPPLDPFFAGQPLNYHYLFNVHALAAQRITGADLYPLLRFYLPVSEFLLLIMSIIAASAAMLRAKWIGWLVVVQFLAFYGYGDIAYRNLQTGNPAILYQLPSMLPALSIFLALLVLIDRFIRERINLATLVFLMFAVAGFRANVLPLIICGLAATLTIMFFTDRQRSGRAAVLLGIAMIAFVVTFWLYFSGENTGHNIMAFSPLDETAAKTYPDPAPLYRWIEGLVGPGKLAVLAFLIVVVFAKLAAFVVAVPLLGHRALWQPQALMLLFVWVAGFAVIALFRNETNEQWAFYMFSHLALTLLLAMALDGAISRPNASRLLRHLLIAAICFASAAQFFLFARKAFAAAQTKAFFVADTLTAPNDPMYRIAGATKHMGLRGVVMPYQIGVGDVRSLPSINEHLVVHKSGSGVYTMMRSGLLPEMARRVDLTLQPITCELLQNEAARFASLGDFFVLADDARFVFPEACTTMVTSEGALRLYRVSPR